MPITSRKQSPSLGTIAFEYALQPRYHLARMSERKVITTMGLGAFASGMGLLATTYIIWIFGVAEFAIYSVSLAKMAIIVLWLEIVPSQYSIFKMQGNQRFAQAVVTFYLWFALLAAATTAVLIWIGVIDSGSWLVAPYAFLAVTQRYTELKTQASGTVHAFGWMPAVMNTVRLAVLALLGIPVANVTPADAMWASLCVGTAVGQVYLLIRFPLLTADVGKLPAMSAVRHLATLRNEFYPYLLNSVLKRLRDSFLPIFADIIMPSKHEVGRLLIYTRANEAVCAQLRVLEAFMVNHGIREGLRSARRRIFFTLGPAAQFGVTALALFLMYREGISATDVLIAVLTSFFVYPYLLEIFWRNDALASFRPRQVTVSLVAFLVGLTLPPLIAIVIGVRSIPIILGSYVLGQWLAAGTYRLYRPASKQKKVR